MSFTTLSQYSVDLMKDDMPALEVYYRKWNDNGIVTKIEFPDVDQVILLKMRR